MENFFEWFFSGPHKDTGFIILVLTACYSGIRYNDLKTENKRLQGEITELKKAIETTNDVSRETSINGRLLP